MEITVTSIISMWYWNKFLKSFKFQIKRIISIRYRAIDKDILMDRSLILHKTMTVFDHVE